MNRNNTGSIHAPTDIIIQIEQVVVQVKEQQVRLSEKVSAAVWCKARMASSEA